MIRFFLPLIIAVSINSHAEETGNGRINYVVKSDVLSITLASQYIYRGFPLAHEQIASEIVSDNVSNIGELFKSKSSEYNEQENKTLKLIQSELDISKTEVPKSEFTPSQEAFKLNVPGYFSCLENSSPIFFKIFSISRQDYLKTTEKEELIQNLNLRLNEDRAILGQSSLEGHLCGKYLGQWSFKELPEIFLYKYLTVLKKLQTSEQKKALAAMISIFHSNSLLSDKMVFLKLTEHQFAKIHFYRLASFDISEIKKTYQKLLQESIIVNDEASVRITQNPINNWEEIESSYNWALEQLQ